MSADEVASDLGVAVGSAFGVEVALGLGVAFNVADGVLDGVTGPGVGVLKIISTAGTSGKGEINLLLDLISNNPPPITIKIRIKIITGIV